MNSEHSHLYDFSDGFAYCTISNVEAKRMIIMCPCFLRCLCECFAIGCCPLLLPHSYGAPGIGMHVPTHTHTHVCAVCVGPGCFHFSCVRGSSVVRVQTPAGGVGGWGQMRQQGALLSQSMRGHGCTLTPRSPEFSQGSTGLSPQPQRTAPETATRRSHPARSCVVTPR